MSKSACRLPQIPCYRGFCKSDKGSGTNKFLFVKDFQNCRNTKHLVIQIQHILIVARENV